MIPIHMDEWQHRFIVFKVYLQHEKTMFDDDLMNM